MAQRHALKGYARQVFDHITLRASDRIASERLWQTVLPELGVTERHPGEASTLYGHFELSIAQATSERPPTTGLHIGLRAPSIDAIHAFWSAGVGAGFASDGEPGPRPEYGDDYYGAFLLDPDGNSIEAAQHGRLRPRGVLDHLWLRTDDLAATRDYWFALAGHAGLERAADEPGELFRVRAPAGGSLTFVAADPAAGRPATGPVHIAIPAARDGVDAWHAAMTEAGHPSDGAPGPRPYHPQYYGGFVLDPNGHSTELVDHDGLLGERW